MNPLIQRCHTSQCVAQQLIHCTTVLRYNQQPHRTLWQHDRRKVPRRTTQHYQEQAAIKQYKHAQQSTPDHPITDPQQSHYDYVQKVYEIKKRYTDAIAQRKPIDREMLLAYRQTIQQYNKMKYNNDIVLPTLPAIVHAHTNTHELPTEQFETEIHAKQRTLAIYNKQVDHTHRILPTHKSDYQPPLPTGHSFAVFEINNKQVKCSANDLIMIPKLRGVNVGDSFDINNVLLLGTVNHTIVGRPYILNTTIECTVEESTYTDKILIFKLRRRKNSRSLQGYRSQVMFVRVNKITFPPEYSELQPIEPTVENSAGNVIDTIDGEEEDDEIEHEQQQRR